jgi:hypothetical protein
MVISKKSEKFALGLEKCYKKLSVKKRKQEQEIRKKDVNIMFKGNYYE